jgi:hypothetical protein
MVYPPNSPTPWDGPDQPFPVSVGRDIHKGMARPPASRDTVPSLPVGLTMRAAHRRQGEHGEGRGVVEAGELVEAVVTNGTGLTLAAHKALLLMLHKAGGDAWQDREFSITKAELRRGHNVNDRLPQLLKQLRTFQVRVQVTPAIGNVEDWEGAILTTKTERRDDPQALVKWRFTEPMRELLRQSRYYADMREDVILPMRSRYSLRLYEVGCSYYRRKHPVWRGTRDELRAMLRVPEGKLRDWTDLKRRALDKAEAELKENAAPFTMICTPHRQKGVVERVEIHFLPIAPQP